MGRFFLVPCLPYVPSCSMLAAQSQRWSQQNLTLEQELDGSTGKPHGSDMSRSHRVDYLNCSHNELAMS